MGVSALITRSVLDIGVNFAYGIWSTASRYSIDKVVRQMGRWMSSVSTVILYRHDNTVNLPLYE